MIKKISTIIIFVLLALQALAAQTTSQPIPTLAIGGETGCSDSDGGIDYYTSSVLTLPTTQIDERCYDANTLLELSCTDEQGNSLCTDTECQMIRVTCEYGCRNGACLKSAKCSNQADSATCTGVDYCYWDEELSKCQDSSNKQLCADQDSGKNYSVQSTTSGFNTDPQVRTSVTDTCTDSTLTEYFCADEYNIDSIDYTCPDGCENGACEGETPGTCEDGDCGEQCEPTYYTCPNNAQVQECKCDEYGDLVCILNPENQCSDCGDGVCSREETGSCSSDCDPFNEYLITKDMGNYRFNYATKDTASENDYGNVDHYEATYQLDSQDIKVVVIQFSSRENAQNALREDILKDGYTISHVINNIVYIINDESIVWMNQNKIIIVNHRKTTYNVVSSSGKDIHSPPITANVAKDSVVETAVEMPVSEVNVNYKERLERISERIGEAGKNNEITTDVIPTPLLIGYLNMHPSDFFIKPECGNEICEYNEWKECKSDCTGCKEIPIIDPDKVNECIENDGKWIESKELNGCPIPPYCVGEHGNDITEPKKTAIVMKLSKLSTKVDNLRNKAIALASYNDEQNNQLKAAMWSSAATEFKSVMDKIGSLQDEVKDMNPDEIKAAIKDDISQIKLNIRNIVNYMIEQHQEEI